MKIVRGLAPMQRWATQQTQNKKSIGFVPTMGALHEGHLSLIRRARGENDFVVVSIFVNPAQFGPQEDFSRYPKPLQKDLSLCRRAGADVVFFPKAEALYPTGYQTWVTVESLSKPLCGSFRPGHFRGVATVVLKLFNLVKPTRAYFGEKDFQQVRVIQQMTSDLNVPVQVIPCPTVREPSGLALSSRNTYLSSKERTAAPQVHEALVSARESLKRGHPVPKVLKETRTILNKTPKSKIQYLEFVDPKTLVSTNTPPGRLMLAVYVGQTRLIDNLAVNTAKLSPDSSKRERDKT